MTKTKKFRILINLLLITALFCTYFPISSHAESSYAVTSLSVSTKEANKGDTVTISLSLQGDTSNIRNVFAIYSIEESSETLTLKYDSKTNTYKESIEISEHSPVGNWKLSSIEIEREDNIISSIKLTPENEGLMTDNLSTGDFVVNGTKKMAPFSANSPTLPVNTQSVNVSNNALIGYNRYGTAIEVSKYGWNSGSDTVVLVNGTAYADALGAAPLASILNAPMLLIQKDKLPSNGRYNVQSELQRLNPKNIILIGGNIVIEDSVADQIRGLIGNHVNIERVWGQDRYGTSLAIAQKIDSIKNIDSIYISYGFGEPDALSIAAKASQDGLPILLTGKDSLKPDAFEWLRQQGLANAYFIGGPLVINRSVLDQVNSITSQNVLNNQVYGQDRHGTNAAVIDYFYPDQTLPGVIVSKSNILADALAAGPLAAKLKYPILLVSPKKLYDEQKKVLNKKMAPHVLQIGGELNTNALNSTIYRLKQVYNAVITLDAGHGGKDSGAVGAGFYEKNLNIEITNAARNYLAQNGIGVHMTRVDDRTLELRDRSSFSNNNESDLTVSIHNDTGSGNGNGAHVIYSMYDKNGGPSKSLASSILNSIANNTSQNKASRGIWYREGSNGNYYHMIREVKSPAVIIECSYMNATDIQAVNTPEKRVKMGNAIAIGIIQYLQQ